MYKIDHGGTVNLVGKVSLNRGAGYPKYRLSSATETRRIFTYLYNRNEGKELNKVVAFVISAPGAPHILYYRKF